jgi:hypothetical protein
MHTEQEAKELWCPMVHSRMMVAVAKDEQHSQETRIAIERLRSQNCIASQCMMWRKHDQIGFGPNGEKRDRDLDGQTRWVDRGYCGLAGVAKP